MRRAPLAGDRPELRQPRRYVGMINRRNEPAIVLHAPLPSCFTRGVGQARNRESAAARSRMV